MEKRKEYRKKKRKKKKRKNGCKYHLSQKEKCQNNFYNFFPVADYSCDQKTQKPLQLLKIHEQKIVF